MKKVICIVALLALTLSSFAQDESKFTVKVGGGLSSVVGSDADTKTIFAYKVGISYDLNLSENFAVVPGLELSSKGFKSNSIDGNINMTYLQVPILAAYKFHISDGINLSLKAGPYVSCGLYGSDVEFYETHETINVFDSSSGYKRFDAGAMAGISVGFNKFVLGLEYSRGFTKLDSDFNQFNQAYGLVLGYRF